MHPPFSRRPSVFVVYLECDYEVVTVDVLPQRTGQFTTCVGFDLFVVYFPCFGRAGGHNPTSLLMLLLVVVTVVLLLWFCRV